VSRARCEKAAYPDLYGAGANGYRVEIVWHRETRRETEKTTDTYVKTGGGAITMGSANGDVYAETGGGSINIGIIKGKVEAKTGGGKIEIGGSEGPVVVSTGGGGITT